MRVEAIPGRGEAGGSSARRMREVAENNIRVSVEAVRMLVEKNRQANPKSDSEESASPVVDVKRSARLARNRSSSVGRMSARNGGVVRAQTMAFIETKPKAKARRPGRSSKQVREEEEGQSEEEEGALGKRVRKRSAEKEEGSVSEDRRPSAKRMGRQGGAKWVGKTGRGPLAGEGKKEGKRIGRKAVKAGLQRKVVSRGKEKNKVRARRGRKREGKSGKSNS